MMANVIKNESGILIDVIRAWRIPKNTNNVMKTSMIVELKFENSSVN